MNSNPEKRKPFTWEAYGEEVHRDPDFDLLALFSFDHLSHAEIGDISCRLRDIGESLKGESTALKADHKTGQRRRSVVTNGGAA